MAVNLPQEDDQLPLPPPPPPPNPTAIPLPQRRIVTSAPDNYRPEPLPMAPVDNAPAPQPQPQTRQAIPTQRPQVSAIDQALAMVNSNPQEQPQQQPQGSAIDQALAMVNRPSEPTFETVRNDPQFIERIRRYYANAHDKTFPSGPEGDTQAFNYYTSDRVWAQDANSVSMARELDRALRFRGQGREDLTSLRDTWNRLPNMLESGGRSPFTVVPQYLGAALADPVTYLGMGVGSLLGRKAASMGINRVVSNLAGQAVADAGISGAQNALQQGASMGVGTQEEFSPASLGISTAAGAVTGPALYGAGRIAMSGARGLRDLTVGGRGSDYLTSLQTEGLSSAFEAIRGDMPTFSQVLARENAEYRAFSNDGNILGTFDTQREADAAVRAAGGGRTFTVEDGVTSLGLPTRIINNGLDRLTAISRLSQLGRRLGDAEVSPAASFDAHMFAVNVAQNAAQTAELSVAREHGGQFRLVDGYMQAIPESQGLGQILDTLPDAVERRDIMLYRMAKRLLHIESGEGRQAGSLPTGLTPQQQQTYRELITRVEASPAIMERWTPVLNQLDTFNSNHLDLMTDLGIYSPEMRQVVEDANLMYLPIHRIIEDMSASVGEMANRALGGGAARERRSVRGLTPGDSNALFSDPARNYARNIQASIMMGVRNHETKLIADTIGNLPPELGRLFGEVLPGQAGPTRHSFENTVSTIRRSMARAGTPEAEITAVIGGLERARENGQSGVLDYFTMYAGMQRRGENVVPYYDNGQMRYLQINNRELMDSMGAFSRLANPRNLLGTGAQFFQYMVTRDPEFWIMTSLPTDTITSQVYSNLRRPGDAAPYVGAAERFFQGAREITSRSSDVYREAIANGVLFSGLGSNARVGNINNITRFLARNGIESDNIFGLTPEQDARLGQRFTIAARNALARGKDIVDYSAEFAEAAPRMGEFMLQRRVPGQSNAESAYRAIQNNIDFRRTPASPFTAEVLRTVPFLRAGNNVMSRLWQSRDLRSGSFFEGAAAGSQRVSDNLTRQAKIAFAVGAPVMTLALINRDNPDYQALSDEDRMMFSHIFIGGQHFRIRRSEDLAQIANIVENAVALWQREDTTGYEAFRNTVLSSGSGLLPGGLRTTDGTSLVANHLPYGARTAFGVATNTQFGGRPIVAPSMEDRQPSERYTEGQTSPMAIALGQEFNVAPAILDFIGRDLLGPAWKYTTDGARLADPLTVSRGAGDIPVYRRMVREVVDDMRSSNWSQRYYELQRESTAATRANAPYEQQGRQDPQARQSLGQLNVRQRTLRDANQQFVDTSRQIAEWNRLIAQAYNNPQQFNNPTPTTIGSTPEERRENFINTHRMMIYAAQYGIAKDVSLRLSRQGY